MSVRDLLRELTNLCDKAQVNPISVDVHYMGGNHLTGKPGLSVEVLPKAFIRIFSGKDVYSSFKEGRVWLKSTPPNGRIHFRCSFDIPKMVHITDTGFNASMYPNLHKQQVQVQETEKEQPRDTQGRFLSVS